MVDFFLIFPLITLVGLPDLSDVYGLRIPGTLEAGISQAMDWFPGTSEYLLRLETLTKSLG